MQYDNLNRLYETQMYAQLPVPVDPADTTSDLVPPFIYDTISAQYDARSNVLSRGGNTYDAPMVLTKVNDGAWTPYNIGRDTQGSITHVMTADGELLERYVYDPWGNAVQLDSFGVAVDTLVIDYPWSGSGIYSKIVGSHGYTEHEHIVGCGLINANARIYDPFLGRFLSPNPLIQDPASTQNFNRYAY